MRNLADVFKKNLLGIVDKKLDGHIYRLVSQGIGQGVVTGILRGSIPKADTLWELANILDVDMSSFFQEEERIKIMEKVTPKQKKYIDKLQDIFLVKNEKDNNTLMGIIDIYHAKRKRQNAGSARYNTRHDAAGTQRGIDCNSQSRVRRLSVIPDLA